MFTEIALGTHRASELFRSHFTDGPKVKPETPDTDGHWKHHADLTLTKYDDGSLQHPVEPALSLPS